MYSRYAGGVDNSPAAPSLGTWTPVADNVWTMRCEPEGVNIGLVAGTNEVLVIDTGSSPEQGRAIAASVEELLGRGVDHVVITHADYDHFFGLAGFGEVTSHAHESLETALESQQVRADAKRLGLDVADLAVPNRTLSLVRALDLGEMRVEILHFGPAHTQGDLLVSVPQHRVLFTGDLVETSGDPQFSDASSIESWPAALDGVLGGANDETVYVPGHGPVTNRMGVFETRANVSMLFGAGEQLVRRGVRLETALAALDAPVDAEGNVHPGASEWEWPFSTETIRAALPKVYAELAGHGLTPKTQLPLLGGIGRMD